MRLNIRNGNFQIIVSVFNRGNEAGLIWPMGISSFLPFQFGPYRMCRLYKKKPKTDQLTSGQGPI